MDCVEEADLPGGTILIHSTDLKNGKLGKGLAIKNHIKLISSPVVLINRVGRPSKDKLVCFTRQKTFGLSDCVFALLCPSTQAALSLGDSIKSNWDPLESQYVGSGAKYLTIKRYINYLINIGYQVTVENNVAKNENKG